MGVALVRAWEELQSITSRCGKVDEDEESSLQLANYSDMHVFYFPLAYF